MERSTSLGVYTSLLSSIPQSMVCSSSRLRKVLNMEGDKRHLSLPFLSSLHIIHLNLGSFSNRRIFNFERILTSISFNLGRLFITNTSKLEGNETYMRNTIFNTCTINCKSVINVKIFYQYNSLTPKSYTNFNNLLLNLFFLLKISIISLLNSLLYLFLFYLLFIYSMFTFFLCFYINI